MRRDRWLFVTLSLVLLALLLWRPETGWELRALLGSREEESRTADELYAQNIQLKAELAKLSVIESQLPAWSPEYIRASVLSRYPFGAKSELLLDIGERQGAEEGVAVAFQGVLLGKVQSVFDSTSVAQTVFDSRFEVAVRIGERGAEALFRGGDEPHLTLISKRAKVEPGDVVYSASPLFPYAIPLGEIEAVKLSEDQLFQEASMKFSYEIGAVRTVFVARQ
ncbi:rod shape-determining protein MreC [Candidatus Parcubacteria bacterium]|nr:MAG: rod shape-determining protein MreC [Candidatus Parcubacteria bacterium]